MKKEKQQLARKLRKQGRTIPSISKELEVSKGSVSLWVRNVKLTKKQKAQMLVSPGRLLGAQTNKEQAALIRHEWFNQGHELAKNNENFRLLSALYWGEGWKFNNENMFSLANCDPMMLKKVLILLKEFSTKQPSVSISAFIDNGMSLKQIAKWWKCELSLTEIPAIRQAFPSSASKKKTVRKQKYGTVQIRIHSTELLQKVLGGISYLGET